MELEVIHDMSSQILWQQMHYTSRHFSQQHVGGFVVDFLSIGL
jgi:hypothetical protein